MPLTNRESLPRAVLFASGAAVVLPLMDGLIKSLVLVYPVILIAWWRFAVMSGLLVAMGARQSGWDQFRTKAPALQTIRAVLILIGTTGFYIGLRELPLAECTAIVFLAPPLSVVLGFFLLRERPGTMGWLAMALGVIGVFLVLRPGGQLFKPLALAVLVSAIAHAAFALVTRMLAKYDSPRVTTTWSSIGALLGFTLVLPAYWTPISRLEDWLTIVGAGCLGALGQYLYALAYRHGHTYVIAPLANLSLPVALFIGWARFGEVPSLWSIAGMILIAAAALLVMSNRSKLPSL